MASAAGAPLVNYDMLGFNAPPVAAGEIPRYGYIRPRRQRVQTSAATRLRYGPSWKGASEAQRANRVADRYYGSGRYRRGRKRRRYRRRRWRGRGLYHGRGGFWGDLWKATKTPLLNVAQAGLGAVPKVGGILAPAFGAIRKATGIGKYDVASNVLVDGASGPHPAIGVFEAPTFTELSDTGAILISHREYVGNIYAPATGVDFEVQQFPLNPGMEETFPWLAQLASNYEEYEMVQLMFSFKSTVSSFQTTTGVVGTILTATQYNTNSRLFEDKKTIMETHGATSCKSTENLIAGVECDPEKLAQTKNKYVRTQGIDIDTSLPQERYDLGRFCVALSDFPEKLADQAIGELWVTYTVKLQRPRVYTGRGNAISTDYHYLTLPSNFTGFQDGTNHVNLPCALYYNVASPGAVEGDCHLWSDTLALNQFVNDQNSIGVKVQAGPLLINQNAQTLNGFLVNSLSQRFSMHTPPVDPASGFTPLASCFSSFGRIAGTYTAGAGTSQGVQVVFPARFAGTVAVRYELCFMHPVLQTYDNVAQFAQILAKGNIRGVFDFLAPWVQGENHSTSVTPPSDDVNAANCLIMTGCDDCSAEVGSLGSRRGARVIIEAHIDVTPATEGIENILEIRGLFLGDCGRTGSPPVAPNQEFASQVSLSVTEYNSTLVDKLDVPTIVNSQTGQRLVQSRAGLHTYQGA